MTHDPNALKRMQEVDRSRQTSELSKRILASVNNTCMGEQTQAWLQNVSENVSVGTPTQATPGQPGAMTMVAIMDKLFDDFQRYAFQFNRAEPNRDYVVTCQRPTASSQREASAAYQGFVQNGLWAMLVRGEPKSITGTFVAPRFMYEDETRRPVVTPFFHLESSDGAYDWKIDNKSITPERVPSLSKIIFARLIRVSRGEVGEREQLTVNLDEPIAVAETGTAATHRADLITESIMTLLETLDLELQELQAAGMAAVKGSNMELMQSIMKRSSDMKEIRESTANVARKWAAVLSSQ